MASWSPYHDGFFHQTTKFFYGYIAVTFKDIHIFSKVLCPKIHFGNTHGIGRLCALFELSASNSRV